MEEIQDVNNHLVIDTTYFKTTSNEATEESNRKELSPLQEEVFKYIRKHRIVTGKSIRLFWSIESYSMESVMQTLFDKELVITIVTQKQVEEFQLQGREWVMSESEARQAMMQEKTTELQSFADEYSRKRRELNRIYEKQEKIRQELSELSKADYQFYHGGV